MTSTTNSHDERPLQTTRVIAASGALLLAAACANSPPMRGESDASSVSAYDVHDPKVDGIDIGQLTDSPLRKAVTMQFDRPVGEVFDFLLEEVDVYSEDIMAADFDNERSAVPGRIALGSVRICTMNDGRELFEPLVAYSEDRYYAYTTDAERSTMKIPVRDVVLFYTFEEKGPSSTLVTVRAHYTPDVFVLMRPLVNALFKRNIEKTFAGAIEKLDGRFVRTGR